MKKLLFVYNPHSGKGMIGQHLSQIIDIFTKGGYEVTVRPTQEKLDGYNYFLERGDGFDVFVCSGGDGTLNETIKALMSMEHKKPLGYIPAGTMNDFASTLCIPKDMPEAAKLIVDAVMPIPVDVGSFNDEYFTYVAAFGLFTSISYDTDQQLKNNFGVLAYFAEALKAQQISEQLNSSYHFKVKYDDVEFEDDFIFGMIANSVSVGGFKGITGKDVWLDDGIFEGLFVRKPSNLKELQLTVNSLLRRDFTSPHFYYFKSDKFYISSEEPVPWTLDGEFGGECTDVTVKNNHCAVSIFSGKNTVTGESSGI